MARSVVASITGAGSQNTGLKYLNSLDLNLSAAGIFSVRAGAANGAIHLQNTTAGAGTWGRSWGSPLAAPSSGTGTWWIENSAGNVTGGVSGDVP